MHRRQPHKIIIFFLTYKFCIIGLQSFLLRHGNKKIQMCKHICASVKCRYSGQWMRSVLWHGCVREYKRYLPMRICRCWRRYLEGRDFWRDKSTWESMRYEKYTGKIDRKIHGGRSNNNLIPPLVRVLLKKGTFNLFIASCQLVSLCACVYALTLQIELNYIIIRKHVDLHPSTK